MTHNSIPFLTDYMTTKTHAVFLKDSLFMESFSFSDNDFYFVFVSFRGPPCSWGFPLFTWDVGELNLLGHGSDFLL